MSKPGTKGKPAAVRAQTEEKAMQIMALCNQKGWQVVVGIEPDKDENVSDVEKLLNGTATSTAFKFKRVLQEMSHARAGVENCIKDVAEDNSCPG